jgi:hypothetical protein
MNRVLMIALAMLAVAVMAGASTLNSDGLVIPGTGDANHNMDRIGLINDGSFESGACGVDWTCYTDTTCEDRILDPVSVWGYPAYDGIFCAWVGGFCGGVPANNGVCQADVFIDGMYLDWYWMGYMEYDFGGIVTCTLDGNAVFTHDMMISDHTYGSWNTASSFWGQIDVSAYCGMSVEICFDFAVNDGGGNMLIDYVTLDGSCGTAAGQSNFSTVKALY